MQLERNRRLASCANLQPGSAFQKALCYFKLIGSLINSAQHRQKRRVGKSSFIPGRRHPLYLANGLAVLSQFMMRADGSRPRGKIAWIVAEDLRIERRGLVESFGLHQNACIL